MLGTSSFQNAPLVTSSTRDCMPIGVFLQRKRLRLRPRGRDLDARQHQRRDAQHEMIRARACAPCPACLKCTVTDVSLVLDGRDLAVLPHAIAELRGEGVRQQLVAALEMKHLALERRQAAQFRDRRLPEAIERGRRR